MARESLQDKIRLALRKRRNELGLTQDEVCQRSSLSLDAVSRIEGGTRMPTLPTLDAICGALNTSIPELLESSKATKKPEHSIAIRRVIALMQSKTDRDQQIIEAVVRALAKSQRRKA